MADSSLSVSQCLQDMLLVKHAKLLSVNALLHCYRYSFHADSDLLWAWVGKRWEDGWQRWGLGYGSCGAGVPTVSCLRNLAVALWAGILFPGVEAGDPALLGSSGGW